MTIPEIKVFPDPVEVAAAAALMFVELAEKYIQLSGRFTVALSGGSTPKAMYELLASSTMKSQVDWASVEVFFGDERCVPPDHEQSNYRMAREAMLSKVPIPGDNIYRMRGEIDPNEAAKEYGQMLKEKFGADDANVRGVDLVLLGMGDDGHTASLFPGTTALDEMKHRCVAVHVEKLNAWRITMSAPFINRAANVQVAVCGEEKSARVAEVLEGARDPKRLPIQLIQPTNGKMTWLLDVAAAGMREV